MSKLSEFVLMLIDSAPHKRSKKAQLDIFMLFIYRVTSRAKNREFAKACMHKITLGEMKAQHFGKSKKTPRCSARKITDGKHCEKFVKVEESVL